MHPAATLPTGINLDPLPVGDVRHMSRDPRTDLAWLAVCEQQARSQVTSLPLPIKLIDQERGQEVRQTGLLRYWIAKAEEEKHLRLQAERERDQWRQAHERLSHTSPWPAPALQPVLSEYLA